MLQRPDRLTEHTGPEQRTWRRADKTNGAGEEASVSKSPTSWVSFNLYSFFFLWFISPKAEESDLVGVDQVQYSLIEGQEKKERGEDHWGGMKWVIAPVMRLKIYTAK